MRSLRPASIVFLGLAFGSFGADAPSPESHLGFRPGADFHLASWPRVVEYFRKVDDASDRVRVQELGQTTEGRPYLAAIVSSPETMSRLRDYQDMQRKLADPRLLDRASVDDELIASSKAVVLITCSIHSNETASTLMAMELLHDLATKNDADTREILDKTILILVPSANPDGIDKVAAWYDRTKGKPWEGSGMPELYHKYAGHDTNRDWFMLNLKETQLLTRLLYKEWFPALAYDVHQMGSRGARLFVPPFFDPINPNLDPRIHQSIAEIGAHMAADLAAQHKKGVLTHAMYDNWWNGGNRTTPQRHNIVAILTEAASVKLASPIFVEKDEIRASTRGFSDARPAINYVEPWPGGWWRLRDIVDYELICARSLLTLAARYKSSFQANYLAMGRDAIAAGKNEPPFAWVVPPDQEDIGRAAEMTRILQDAGVEVHRARSAFRASGATYPEGSWIFKADQPYRPHLKDMMERQVYPARFTASGAAEPPYDVAGWTLPLQMGVKVAAIGEKFEVETELARSVSAPRGGMSAVEDAKAFVVANRSNDDFIVLNALLREKIEVSLSNRPTTGEPSFPEDAYVIANTAESRKILEKVLPTVSSKAVGVVRVPNAPVVVKPRRIGVYQPWTTSMDEGWTRLTLEKFQFPFETLHNSDLQVGNLSSRIDVLVIPSITPRVLRDGWKKDETEPAYTGGIGDDGSAAIREFVRQGGILVCLEDSSTYAIEEFKLPIVDPVKGLTTSAFYGPGSIVRIDYAYGKSPGSPSTGSAYFDRSLAFNLTGATPGSASPRVEVVARYAEDRLLESGWLLGPEKLHGKAAVVAVNHERGRIILFAFPPQHRGQTHGTFRLLFNAILGLL
jgi:Zinc carboxypeptidase